jgi:hypothetical protein
VVVRNHKRRNRRHNQYPPDRLGQSRSDWTPTLAPFEVPRTDGRVESPELPRAQPEGHPSTRSEPVPDDI